MQNTNNRESYNKSIIEQNYISLCNMPSDINEHLPTLYRYATECESIIELGVRGCISSWALVNGLLQNKKTTKKILLNDLTECDIRSLLDVTNDLGVVVEYKWMNDLHLILQDDVDLTFIDTWHVYGQLKRELIKFSKITRKYIIMHNTTVDEIYGETIRNNWNAVQQSYDSGIPVVEIKCGLGKAIDEFLIDNKNWILKERFTNNNGLTVLERIN